MKVDGTPTKEEVLEAYEASRNFLGTIQEYVEHRSQWDPDWKAAEEFYAYSDTIRFDPDGDVEIEWVICHHCRDRDRYHKTFPAEHLWDPNAEARVREEIVAREKIQQEKLAAQRRAAEEATKKHELEQLAHLQRKYQVGSSK